MSDEEVIKRRLLIDGDGTGDDRRLNILIKTFIKWCYSMDSTENTQIIYDRMLAQLAQCEFTVTKSNYSARMMEQELKNYDQISKTIENGIEHAKIQIEQNKLDLSLAKNIRKNRMQYDVLAKVINQQPDRKKTIQQLDALNTELRELEESRQQLQRKLEIKRNDFTVLMRSIRELQTKLDNSGPPSQSSDINKDEQDNDDDEDDADADADDGNQNKVKDADAGGASGDGDINDSTNTNKTDVMDSVMDDDDDDDDDDDEVDDTIEKTVLALENDVVFDDQTPNHTVNVSDQSPQHKKKEESPTYW